MLTKNFTSKQYVPVFNCFFNEDSKFNLNECELFLYSSIYTQRMYDDSVRVNADLLNQFIHVRYYKYDKDNIKKVKETLESLINKQVLILHNEVKEIKNNTMLEVGLNINELSNDGMDEKKEGMRNYSSITYEQFLKVTSIRDYYIYCVAARWRKGFICSYARWGEILSVNERSAKRIIKDAVTRGIIYKNTGDYKDSKVDGREQKKQDENVYRILPFTSDEKTKEQKKVEHKVTTDEHIQEKVNEAAIDSIGSDEDFNEEMQDVIERFKTYKVDGENYFPTDFEWYYYVEAKYAIQKKTATKQQRELFEVGEKRKNALYKNEKSQYHTKKLIDEARDQFEHNFKKELVRNATNAVLLKSDEIVAVNANNIDQINVEDVKSIFYSNGKGNHLNCQKSLESFQLMNMKNEYIDNPKVVMGVWGSYKQYVRDGISLDFNKVNYQIKDNVIKEIYPNFTDEAKGFSNKIKEAQRKRDLNKQKEEESKVPVGEILDDADLLNQMYGPDDF
ncbi:hypothetical protein [Evansella cellulosilytica]|uniref:Uncharacterized protein n=1 Tax=Evansella cellulosilytica (strain ATCC 21833 / DSM 2522 / FERM P-1141 / JCM 9156 / N-4) TaxID=649639 RepID=E6U1H7_EVAC2|nr:hypothetical protein [Evansella cellulosilytica]ADU30340.1 hypothetical protein Bcell_2079 [Evansella cellulosilytica DSM 2522]